MITVICVRGDVAAGRYSPTIRNIQTVTGM